MPDTYQYVKLPDGTYGKFSASATDTQIRAQIAKDFPSAYKQPESAWEHFAGRAGIPAHLADVGPMIRGMLLPSGDPNAKTTGESIPLLGPVLTSQQQVLNQPGAWAKVFGSLPLVGPPGYRGAQDIQNKDWTGLAGDIANIVTQVAAFKGGGLKPGEVKPTVAYSPEAAVRPGTAVLNAPQGFLGKRLASSFGLRPDYADKIASKVDEIQKTRQQTESEITDARRETAASAVAARRSAQAAGRSVAEGAERDTSRVIDNAQFTRDLISSSRDQVISGLERQFNDLQTKQQSAVGQLVADTTKAAYE